ncbi:MAG: toll/interleukin-1 receptor domain-containing protein, partial [Cyanobacteria bacterium J06576_12]
TKKGLKVWFSREHLKYGQSILGVITKVIQNSSSGIVVLSKSTFSDERHFPIQELTTLYNQNIYRKLLLFPIYHGISHDYILDHYPMLSDLYACNTKQGVEAIAKEFVQQLRRHQKEIR